MNYVVALFIFVLVFALVDLVCKKVPPLASAAELIAIAAGGLAALFYLGVIR